MHSRSPAAARAAILAVLVAAPAGLSAQSAPAAAERPAVVESLFACRAITDDRQRLACFDEQVAAVERAEASRDLVLADRAQIKEARKGLFGFSLPRIRLFGGGDDEDEPEPVTSIEAGIVSSSRTPDGKLFVVLDTGARWVQTDGTQVLGEFGAGDTITIERAALGSYMGKIGRKRAFRIRRVE